MHYAVIAECYHHYRRGKTASAEKEVEQRWDVLAALRATAG